MAGTEKQKTCFDCRKRFTGGYGWRCPACDAERKERLRQERQAPKAAPATGKKKRPCMCCQASFLSEGAHNRLCARCRRIEPEVCHGRGAPGRGGLAGAP